MKAWRKLRADAGLQAVILAAIGQQRQSPDWLRDAGQFIPYPATWLNDKRWTDEATEPGLFTPKTAGNAEALRRAGERLRSQG